MPNLLALFYLSLRLVKVLRLPATPALLCSARRCANSRPPHNVTNLKFDLFNFCLLVEETGLLKGNHRSVIIKLRKTASVMIADLTHCYWDSNSRSQH